MKIAVVGGNGFIGQEFIRYASKHNHELYVIEKDIDVFEEDGQKKAREILSKCDAMVFLAAIKPTGEFTFNEYLYNIRLAEKYFDVAKDSSIDNVVITSSRSVYSSGSSWKEKDFDTPLSLYGASKLAVDSLALLYNRQFDMKIKSLRLAQVLGLGERKGFLLNTLIDNARNKEVQHIFGEGIGRRQYIYVKDVCDAILHCLEFCKDSGGIYNIGMNYNVSIIELAEMINDVFGNAAGIEIHKDKPEDKKQYLMDVSKAEKELNWKPRYNLKEALEDIRDND